jgi:hypothetical protein
MPDDTKGRQFSRRDRIAELSDLLERERAERDAEQAEAEERGERFAAGVVELFEEVASWLPESEAAGLRARLDALLAGS